MSLPEADYGLTDAAMQGGGAQGLGDDTLLVKFFINPRQDMDATATANRPIFKDCEYVQIIQPGNKDSIIRRPAMDMDKHRFPEHYRKFKAREDQESTTGTPLAQWTGVTKSQVEELRYMNVLTVEQLAGMTDVNAQGFMGISQLRENAKRFLTAADGAKLGNALAEKDEQIARLAARLEALENADHNYTPALNDNALMDPVVDQEAAEEFPEETGDIVEYNKVESAEEAPAAEEKPAGKKRRSRKTATE